MKDLKKQIMDILEEKHGTLILTGDMEEMMFKLESLFNSNLKEQGEGILREVKRIAINNSFGFTDKTGDHIGIIEEYFMTDLAKVEKLGGTK